MSKMWLVAREEFRTHVQKKSFLVGLLSVPVIAVVIIVVGLLLSPQRAAELPTVGYVDPAGLLTVPLSAEEAARWEVRLIPLADEAAADDALARGEVMAYYVVPADYPENNRVLVYTDEGFSEEALEAFGAFRSLLRTNLVAGQPPEIARRIVEGSEQVLRLTDGREIGTEFNVGYLVPVLAGAALFVLIFFGAGYLMMALTEEKANRTMEILVTSLSANQLMAGKIVGIVGVVLTQLAAWAAFGIAGVIVGRGALNLDWLVEMRVEAGPLVLVAVLVLGAFVLIAALMTAVGVIVDDPRAGQQVMGVFVTFSLLPLGFIGTVLWDINGGLAVALSMIPLTAPMFLPLRMALAVVPTWQIAASVAILYLLALGALWLAGRAVRLGMLRYGQAVRWGELFGRPARRARPEAAAAEPRRAAQPRRDGGVKTVPLVRSTRRSKIWLILRQELVGVITRPWFALSIIGLPLLIFGQMFLFFRQTGPSDADIVVGMGAPVTLTAAPKTVGYVDQANLIASVPVQVPPDTLVAYPDEASAHQALQDGDIASYVIIPPDYVQAGDLIIVRPDLSPSMENDYLWFKWLLLANLLGGDMERTAQVWTPLYANVEGSTPPEASAAEDEEAEGEARLTSMLIVLLFYAVILMAAGFLLRSVSEEKKNRTIEVLLLSASPGEILTGKTIALGLVGLLQGIGWVFITYLLFTLGGMTFRLPGGVTLSPAFLLGTAVFFLLGYALYASLYAGAGALVPDWRQSSGISLLIVVPAFIGFEISIMAENPHSLLMVIASLFPLSAPIVMIRRLLSGGVPLW
ncbi:MAG: ABC transporter permease, partial [Anaerolineae bacterium]|nr:ABC transporter permease [Anaerolineae bacterium]